MNPYQSSDSLAVVNGPEDGGVFPIFRSPFQVGSSAACGAQLRLDRSVQDIHAMLSPVANGYRVRAMTASPTYVNGKRAGRILSRIVPPRGEIQIGHTTLLMKCSPEGLANRGIGLDLQSDLVWALRRALQGCGVLLGAAYGFVLRMLQRVLRHWMLSLIVILGGLYLYSPWFHYLLRVIIYRIRLLTGL